MNKNKNLIGIIGKAHSGKDTYAKYFIQDGYKKYSFADPIKKAAKEIFLFSDDQLWGNKKEEIDPRWGLSPRKALQIIGTEMFQYDLGKYIPEFENKIGRSIWVKRFEYLYTPEQKIIIPDVRFKHEIDVIKKLKGILIKIERDGSLSSEHLSEKELDDFNDYDQLILNNGSIEDLKLIYSRFQK